MLCKVPILPVAPALRRGGTVMPPDAFERLHTTRVEQVLAPAWIKILGQPEREPPWLLYRRIDGSTHIVVQQGANGLPTLLPRFLANNVPIRRLTSLSCDDRPHPNDLFRYYCKAAAQHFGGVLKDAASALGTLPSTCRLSICIPVAARDEQGFIGRTLRSFARQTAPKNLFEVAIFLNCLDSSGRVDERSRHTIAEVEQVMRDHPDLNVKPFFAALPDSEIWTIGRIRKLLMDAVTLRVYDRRAHQRQQILVTTDADASGVHPRFVDYYLSAFARHPEVDAIRGRVDWDWRALSKNPLLLIGVRLMGLLDAQRRTVEPTYGVGTPSVGMRVERYMDAGGYNALDKVGEDIDLLERLEAIRAGSSVYKAIVRGGPHSRVWTSLRRAEHALGINNTPPANMWFVDGARFQLDDAAIRQGSAVMGASFMERMQDPAFIKNAEDLIAKTLAVYERPHAEVPVSIEDLMGVVNRISGIELIRDGQSGDIKVGNERQLRALLIKFHDEAQAYWREQLGFEW